MFLKRSSKHGGVHAVAAVADHDDVSIAEASVHSAALSSVGGGGTRSLSGSVGAKSLPVSPGSFSRRRRSTSAKRRPSGNSFLSWGGPQHYRERQQRDHDDDDHTDVSSVTSPAALSKEDKMLAMEIKGEQLLQEIEYLLSLQQQKEEQLRKAIAVHTDRAKARLASDNSVGATISVKNVKRYQREHSKVAEAVEFLESQQATLQSRINEVQVLAAMQIGDGAFSSFSTVGGAGAIINYDLSGFEDCAEKVDNMLSATESCTEDCSSSNTDEDLMGELAAAAL